MDDGNVLAVSARSIRPAWKDGQHDIGRWVFAGSGNLQASPLKLSLGETNATALTGDFDGDGVDEAVIYVAGQWFVDLNGNGRWDEGDLWIQLGTEMDRPVIGDWDGDGKDDVAIFGRQWQRDFLRIIRDPGLPDPANLRRRSLAAQPGRSVEEDRGEDPRSWLRRGDDGSLRADVVDHVFKYGEHVDTPVAGDWNGDGIDQVGVFREGNWMLDVDGDGRWTESDQRFTFGDAGDVPVVGDFDGDGLDEIGVVRGDLWIIDTDGDRRLTGNDLQIEMPRSHHDSQPVVGDLDGDGRDEPGYYDEAA